MKTRIQKWGNSLALRLPKFFAQEIHLEQGTMVEVSLQEGTLRITPLAPHPSPWKAYCSRSHHRTCITRWIRGRRRSGSVVEPSTLYVPARGDAIWINLHPQAGHEQAGRRPAVAAFLRSV